MKVLIVDDHALIAEGISNLLAAHGFQVAGVAADGQEGVEKALRLVPDVVLMDIRMPKTNGLAATRLIKASRPDIQVIILTASAEDEDLFEAIKSGANGYLLKSVSGTDFIEALQGMQEGVPPFSPGLANRLLRELTRQPGSERSLPPENPSPDSATGEPAPVELNDRQVEVLRLLAGGLTYKEVGQKLAISEHTVRYHMREIMALLHLENRSQVIAYAGKMGIK